MPITPTVFPWRTNPVNPFKEKLNVDTAYSCRKPFKKKYKKILELYKYKEQGTYCNSFNDLFISEGKEFWIINNTSFVIKRIKVTLVPSIYNHTILFCDFLFLKLKKDIFLSLLYSLLWYNLIVALMCYLNCFLILGIC